MKHRNYLRSSICHRTGLLTIYIIFLPRRYSQSRFQDIYGDLCQIATPTFGRINNNGSYIEVTSIWDNRVPALKKMSKTERMTLLERGAPGQEHKLLTSMSMPLVNLGYSVSFQLVTLIQWSGSRLQQQQLEVRPADHDSGRGKQEAVSQDFRPKGPRGVDVHGSGRTEKAWGHLRSRSWSFTFLTLKNCF